MVPDVSLHPLLSVIIAVTAIMAVAVPEEEATAVVAALVAAAIAAAVPVAETVAAHHTDIHVKIHTQ